MKLIDDQTRTVNFVRSFAAGELRVGERVLTENCLIAADAIVADWPAQSIDTLEPEHLDAVLALDPELVLLGSGLRQRFPAPELLAKLLARGVGCEVMATDAACRTYNVLVSENRRVVAALILR